MALSFRFGTVGSPRSTPPKPGGSVGAILRLRELDLDALELGWVQAVRVSESTCTEIRAAAAAQDVLISVHAPYFINLNADEAEWAKSRKRLMDAAHYGHLAGATDIVFHPGSYFGRRPEEVLPTVLRRLGECVAELRQRGNPVVLRPETMGKAAMLGSLEDTLLMSREIEGVAPCIDFAHLHARAGDGSMNSYAEWQKVLEQIAQALGEEALQDLHIHLSGIEYSAKGEREHLILQDSDLDVEAILRALKDFRCRGRILCESPVLEDDALILRRLWLEISGESP
ncbi:MAG: TIM barrel protein [Anaerolineales bacterium]|nr:TIM barrel protein [Anaerolineales bacterium]MCS7248660.1 TIM barrel protein [Anaerolineales bacterium]MDW8162473.1 TIM barrel protein [Anaerolineales bacterium]MDW8447908.1 TIM barrel protein [Anaerolineales bacterium]